MKIITIAILLSFSVLNVFSQGIDERTIDPFEKLKISGKIKVYINKGTKEKVKITATGIDLSEIITEVKSNTLYIKANKITDANSEVEIFLTYCKLTSVSAHSSCTISFQEPINGEEIAFSANYKSEIVCDLDFKSIDVKVRKGGNIRLKGKTGKCNAKISSGGILSALDLISDSTFVKVSTAGLAKVNTKLFLDAKVKIGGNLTYSGLPNEKKIKSGIGSTVTEIE